MTCQNCETKSVAEIIEKWHSDKEYVIEMMQDVQDEFRHTSRESLETISQITKTPLADLYHIATFYKAFSLEPKGKFQIQVCMGTACHVKGADRVLEAFERELNIRDGETSHDQQFSLDGVRCIGCCSLAPVITVNEEIFGEVEPAGVPKILKKFKED
ncbi:MAG: NAD(P)H-dependent oxidoreductase subunit E [Bacteroidetes bacterium]|nr:NAD(P)H-dependent oxidoreductase subunit E [Bacteroidota bacterium]